MLSLAALTLSGCSNAKQGAVSGAGVGALSGLAIGSLTGEAGKGAAIGAIVGGVGGAVIGDQNRRRDEAFAQSATSSTQPSANQPYTTGYPLGNLVGDWIVRGSVNNGNGGTLPVSGSAKVTAEKNFFVRIELRINDPRNGQAVEGTSVISQTGGRGVEMTNSFSSLPQVRRFKGEMDSTGTVFNFAQVEPAGESRKIVLRVPGRNGFSADAWEGSKRLESYTFSPASKTITAATAN